MLCCSLKTQLWLFLRAVDSSVSIQSSHKQLKHCTLNAELSLLLLGLLFWVVHLNRSHNHAWLPKLNLWMLSTLFHVPLLQISNQAPRPIHFSCWTPLESVLPSASPRRSQVCLTLSDLLQFYLINFNRQLSAYKHLKIFHWWQWSSYNPNLIMYAALLSGNLNMALRAF